jgi:hypothetical protein
MKRYDSIEQFCKEEHTTIEELKDYILRTALTMGCECNRMYEGDAEEVQRAFLPLYFFNEILNKVK